MNTTILMGRLTKDVEIKTISSGTTVANFSIAYSEKYKDQEKTSFFECTAWGKTGENIQKYFKKGERILVTGKIEQQRWEQEGAKRSKVIITVLSFDFIEGKSKGDMMSTGKEVPSNQFEDSGEIPF